LFIEHFVLNNSLFDSIDYTFEYFVLV